MYRYSAELVRVIDGDTIIAIIDLGFSTWVKKTIRFYGIDAPESRTLDLEEKAKGIAATVRLVEILNLNNHKFIVKSYDVDKFGRCLGELFVETLGETSVQQTLINEGHYVPYFGGAR